MRIQSVKSWSSTLNLPKSSFPHRTSPGERAQYLKRCTGDLYAWQTRDRIGALPFILHDGPPYANGSLHIGHALNKILKDVICRTELHQGRKVKFVPGWDCHGLPIEIKALEQRREKGQDGKTLDAISVRRMARSLATKTVKEQKRNFQEWAVMADWDNTWTTMDRNFEMEQLAVFQEMVKRGTISRRYKPVYWSPSSITALAESELEYRDDHISVAAFVKLPIITVPEKLKQNGVDVEKLSAVIWTTTAWTLPANKAIAIHPKLNYVVVQCGQEQLLIMESRLEYVTKMCSIGEYQILTRLQGSELEGTKYLNPLNGRQASPNPIIVADFVSSESGSGMVHCAPGHGMEDYDICAKLGIPAFAPINDVGCFTDAAFPDNPKVLAGISVLKDGSAKVVEILGNKVLGTHNYKHKYPYDWRTRLPVIVRATEQWFADVSNIKKLALKSLESVKFVPETGKSRLGSFIRGRNEWCISRQRAWGVPIPALYDKDGLAVLTSASVAHIISVIGARGVDAWWTDHEDDPAWVVPGLSGSYRRGKDTMDVWFDSGTSWTQTEGPADVYCEGTDQHRGWFQSSLLTHSTVSGLTMAPFRTLITHGFTLDEKGRKMSKSIGNVIAPHEIMEGTLLPPLKRKGKSTGAQTFDGLGPDALRLWVASSDYTSDIIVGQPSLKATNNSLLKYRTVFKMLLGSMRIRDHNLPLSTLDKIALMQLDKAVTAVWKAWGNYEFHRGVMILNRWLSVDLSSFYLEGIKDRLYCGDGGSVIYLAYQSFLQMLAPITPVLVEEAWEHRPHWMKQDDSLLHPLHQVFNPEQPLSIERSVYTNIENHIPWLINANSAIKAAQEQARSANLIGSSLQSSVVLHLPELAQDLFSRYEDDLASIFVVSSVTLSGQPEGDWKYSAEFDAPGGIAVAWIAPPKDAKCVRCWRYVALVEDGLCGRCEEVLEKMPGVLSGATISQ